MEEARKSVSRELFQQISSVVFQKQCHVHKVIRNLEQTKKKIEQHRVVSILEFCIDNATNQRYIHVESCDAVKFF